MSTLSAPAQLLALAGRRVLVCGVGVAGASAARALLGAGAQVALTAATEGPAVTGLVAAGARWLGPLTAPGSDVELLVVSPGLRPHDPLLQTAAGRGLPIWGEAELAWLLRGPNPAPWLALTGTNGKTTTVHMLEAMLTVAGLRAAAVGNVGVPMIDAVLADPPYDVLAVELSSQQLHFAPSIAPFAGALLNLAPDHLDWHGSMAAYEHAKTAVWRGAIAIGNVDDPRVRALLPAGGTGFTLAPPADGQLGVVDDALVSRAFGDADDGHDGEDGDDGEDRVGGVHLAGIDEVRPAGRHNVANALAAAALARAFGLAAQSVAGGLRAFVPDPHRNALVGAWDGVRWIDDSKATNPHAAQASLTAAPSIVWVAGGQLKGVVIDDLVAGVAGRLRAAVLLGADRAVVAAALARHAPDVPVFVVDKTDDGAMSEVVHAAAGYARAGDTVLLAPAAASYDMFANFGARGDAFAAAVRELHSAPSAGESG